MARGRKLDERIVTYTMRNRKTGEILHHWDCRFVDKESRGFNSPLFARAVLAEEQRVIQQLFVTSAVVHRRGWKRKVPTK